MNFIENEQKTAKQDLMCVGKGCYIVSPETTRINPYAFTGNLDIEYLIIPSTVKIIGESAFEACASLKCLIIAEGVVYIDRYAFRDCCALETIYLPNSLEKVETTAFGAVQDYVNDNVVQIGGDNNVRAIIYAGTKERYYEVTKNLILNIFEITKSHCLIQQFTDSEEVYCPIEKKDSRNVTNIPFYFK